MLWYRHLLVHNNINITWHYMTFSSLLTPVSCHPFTSCDNSNVHVINITWCHMTSSSSSGLFSDHPLSTCNNYREHLYGRGRPGLWYRLKLTEKVCVGTISEAFAYVILLCTAYLHTIMLAMSWHCYKQALCLWLHPIIKLLFVQKSSGLDGQERDSLQILTVLASLLSHIS